MRHLHLEVMRSAAGLLEGRGRVREAPIGPVTMVVHERHLGRGTCAKAYLQS